METGPGNMQHTDEADDCADLKELPVVDELEIAALAAGYTVYESSSESEDSSMEETEDEDLSNTSNGIPSDCLSVGVDLICDPNGDSVKLVLTYLSKHESDKESDISEDEGFKNWLSQMEGEGADPQAMALRDVDEAFSGLEPPEPVGVELCAEGVIRPVGEIASVCGDNHIVVQAPDDAKVLAEESVLCLDDRTPLGRVEEIIGPVTGPLYLLRYAGPSPMPQAVCVGARVNCLLSHTKYILEEEKEAFRAHAASSDEECDGDLSDDNAEVILEKLQTNAQGGKTRANGGSKAENQEEEKKYRTKLNPSKKAKKAKAQPQELRPRQPHQSGQGKGRGFFRQRPTAAGRPPGGRWIWVDSENQGQQAQAQPNPMHAAHQRPPVQAQQMVSPPMPTAHVPGFQPGVHAVPQQGPWQQPSQPWQPAPQTVVAVLAPPNQLYQSGPPVPAFQNNPSLLQGHLPQNAYIIPPQFPQGPPHHPAMGGPQFPYPGQPGMGPANGQSFGPPYFPLGHP